MTGSSLFTDLNSDLESAGEPNIFSQELLSQEKKILEALWVQPKRQKIVEAYRDKAQRIIDNAGRDFAAMNLSDESARAFVDGFEGALEKTKSQMNELFTRRVNAETAKSQFLGFMLKSFPDYTFVGSKIRFSTQDEIEQYDKLGDAVTDSQKAYEKYAADMVDASQKQLNKFVQ